MKIEKDNDKEVYVGIGFHLGVEAVEIENAIYAFLEELEIELKEVKGLCTADFRKTEQLQEVSYEFGIPLFLFSRDEINSVDVRSKSAATEALNIKGVAEPCAILGAKMNKDEFKFVKRKSFDRKITLAVVF
ncbi:MAG: cobalamin biosynthesis protein [Methanophagales archaeon]|nr:cobalamin biosynthesis protein [Methanophagales archaeon]